MKYLVVLCYLSLFLLPGGKVFGQNTFPANGNVGIGTLAPDKPLTVFGVSRLGSEGYTGATARNGIHIGTNGNFSDIKWETYGADRFSIGIDPITDQALFRIRYQGTDRMTINSLGNVGLGTTYATAKFDLNAGTNANLTGLNIANTWSSFANNNVWGGKITVSAYAYWTYGLQINTTQNNSSGGGYTAVGLDVTATNNGTSTGPNSTYAGRFTANNGGTAGYFSSSGAGGVAGNFASGIVKIGSVTTPAGYKLYVESGILTEKVKVAVKTSGDWSDYVFDPSYQLRSISNLKKYLEENRHLPGIPSADEVVENGIDLAKMDAALLEKIEELSLYIIHLQDQIDQLEATCNGLSEK